MSRVVSKPPDEPPDADGSRVGGWWRESDDGQRVLCGVCPRGCSLGPGDRGFCFVRQNREGRMVSTTYGRSTGFCVDPIEKKPLNQFYPGTPVLSFGTAGCNLGCKFCQNWSMSRSKDVEAASETASPETVANAAAKLGCRSVAFTYNDPIIWAEYAIDTAKACHDLGVKTVAVTSGYITAEAREDFYKHLDAANVDLKGFSEDFYQKLTGGHLEPVLDTLRWLARETDIWTEITNLVIPTANDSPDELKRMCDWIVGELGPDVPIHFSAFHPDFKMTEFPSTPTETLLEAHRTACDAGLRYVYTGNVADREHQSTYCPGCRRVVIERDGYILGRFELRKGQCGHCQTPIAGRFDARAGEWGGRRVPVDIASYAVAAKPTVTKPEPAKRPKPAGDGTVRPELSKQQESTLFEATGRRVAAIVRAQAPEALKASLSDLAGLPVYGAFVSLKCGGQLRSCCGMLGESLPLGEAVDRAADRAAKEDPRFPPISPTELGVLDMEVWLLWGLQPVAQRGKDRARAVEIGRHGLQITKGHARGLLLPGVAIDHNLDAKGFLKQVCLKAGLPPDAWQDDATTLMIFEGYAIKGRLDAGAAVDGAVPGGPTAADVAALADFARSNIVALLSGATPSYYMTGGFDGGVSGLAITVGNPGEPEALDCSKLSMRPQMPLQTTLFSLIDSAAQALRAQGVHYQTVQSAPLGLSVLLDPAMHGTADEPSLASVDPKHRAMLVIDGPRSAWVFDPSLSAEQLLETALKEATIPDRASARVMSMAVVSTQPRVTIANVPRPQSGPEVRPAAVAGTFYPGKADEIDRMLDEMLPKKRKPKPWPGLMVPHAGWTYSGRLAAEVLSRVKIPDRVIILCPKHRSGGAEWAVAPHRVWSLPCGEVASDPELAQRLAQGIDGLEADSAAHRQEHAIEVQLPLLAKLAPEAKVVGITIGGGTLPRLQEFGRQMADVLRAEESRPLLVISSDMNHFADEARTRRIDRMALDAMETLDPAKLYETVRENQISMCGMFPAVIVMETLKQLGQLSRSEEVGYSTSAESSGDTSRVVGYAGVLLG